jgi:transcriptional regulator with XRE-family HTH domain
MAGRGNSPAKNGRAQTAARDHERIAFDLRKKGWSQYQIADQIGVSQAAVSKILSRVMARLLVETHEDAEAVRKMELDRLDAMLLALGDKVADGDVAAIEASLKIAKRRAELLGLDAPKRSSTELTGDPSRPLTVRAVELTDDQLAAIATGKAP